MKYRIVVEGSDNGRWHWRVEHETSALTLMSGDLLVFEIVRQGTCDTLDKAMDDAEAVV